MAAKSNVQTSLLGRRMLLTPQNIQAAKNYIEKVNASDRPPWIKVYPDGGEVVAVSADRDGNVRITLATPELVTLNADWLQLAF